MSLKHQRQISREAFRAYADVCAFGWAMPSILTVVLMPFAGLSLKDSSKLGTENQEEGG